LLADGGAVVAMLALFASGQINMRKVNGCQRFAIEPIDSN
jgi:hypothetical protein